MKQIKVLIVEPGKKPYTKEIGADLESLQKTVGGYIQAIYPWDDPVALVCDEESKLTGKELNRALYTEDGTMYDIIAGTFFICGLGAEDFVSLSEELADKYAKLFIDPELFVWTNNGVTVVPVTES